MNQAGSGFGNVYAGGVYQKGHGIGSFLSGLFRCVLPILKKGSATVGSELLKSGANIIADISRNESPEISIKKRGKEALHNLSQIAGDNLFGCGYKQSILHKRPHLSTNIRSAKKAKVANNSTKKKGAKKSPKQKSKNITKKPRRKSEVIDIFA